MKANSNQINFIIAILALVMGVFNAFSKTSVKHEKFMKKTIERADSLGGDTTFIVTKGEVYDAIVNLNQRAPNHDAVVNLFVPWAMNATNELITQLELQDSSGQSVLIYSDFVKQRIAKAQQAKESESAAKDAEISRLKAQLEAAQKKEPEQE